MMIAMSIISHMEEQLEDIIELLDNPNIFEILDIRGFDLYVGAYAIVKIFNRNYKIWCNDDDSLFIEDFPISNSGEGNNDGFIGYYDDVAELLNDINIVGSVDIYMKSKKYNL